MNRRGRAPTIDLFARGISSGRCFKFRPLFFPSSLEGLIDLGAISFLHAINYNKQYCSLYNRYSPPRSLYVVRLLRVPGDHGPLLLHGLGHVAATAAGGRHLRLVVLPGGDLDGGLVQREGGRAGAALPLRVRDGGRGPEALEGLVEAGPGLDGGLVARLLAVGGEVGGGVGGVVLLVGRLVQPGLVHPGGGGVDLAALGGGQVETRRLVSREWKKNSIQSYNNSNEKLC